MRRSRSDGDFAVPELLSAIEDVREAVEQTLGVSCEGTEPSYGLNVHNDGDFYLPHQDTGPGPAAQRLLTFVYYLHRTPRPFQGGNLRVFDVVLPVHTEGVASWEDRTWRDWEPEHDSIVFFRPPPGTRCGRSAARPRSPRTAASLSTAGCAAQNSPTPAELPRRHEHPGR
ncbi:2OG-Fe(II) oxygenase [Streptomyces kronopolitis]|nr:2OG-Fe(II) oxygenase [Streptomyces kronopolitis]